MNVKKFGKSAVIVTPDAGFVLTRYDAETMDITLYAGYTRVMCSQSQVSLYHEITIAEHNAFETAKEIALAEQEEETPNE